MQDLMGKAKNFVAEKVADMEKPEADITDVDLKDVGKEGITYMANVSIKNPYSASIPICEIHYSLKSANRVIASGNIPDPRSLKGNDTTVVDVEIKVPHSVLVSLIKDIGADWISTIFWKMGLVIDLPLVDNITIPLSKKGEMRLPCFANLFK
ncbi:desiccation-related protein PCC27-45-like [Olea europaea var. sylvestris]|uniref:desiccation-related protein PCC27-45-like n=1 Tax=Olea europaea var. sylvestris TaxID=158386 RepID=UPI000C1D1EC7|nr:desiccation-related protein PCC27-45-like [Olea europaea var. sylvestris]